MNILSLDAPLVALVWQALFARCFHLSIRWPAIVALALSTWFIYVMDRILDTRSLQGAAISSRHEFSRLHGKMMFGSASLVIPVLLWTCLHMRAVVFRNGLWMLAAVAVYFAIVHTAPKPIRRIWPKEVAVGVLFALGTSLATWSLAAGAESARGRLTLIAPTLIFASLCSLNCIAIEFWESRRSGVTPAIHPLTGWVGMHIGGIALTIAAMSMVLAAFETPRPVFLAGLLSAAPFIWLNARSDSLCPDTLRFLADAAMLSPLLLLGVAP